MSQDAELSRAARDLETVGVDRLASLIVRQLGPFAAYRHALGIDLAVRKIAGEQIRARHKRCEAPWDYDSDSCGECGVTRLTLLEITPPSHPAPGFVYPPTEWPDPTHCADCGCDCEQIGEACDHCGGLVCVLCEDDHAAACATKQAPRCDACGRRITSDEVCDACNVGLCSICDRINPPCCPQIG